MIKKNFFGKKYIDNLGYKLFCILFIWLYYIYYSYKYIVVNSRVYFFFMILKIKRF